MAKSVGFIWLRTYFGMLPCTDPVIYIYIPYLEITNDLHRQGLNVKYDAIEIGALGHSTKDTP